MASAPANNFFSSTLLHSTMFLPDDIWISRTQHVSQLKKNNCLYSISDINDSDLYSTVDDIDTTCLFSDQPTFTKDKTDKASKKQKKIHFQDQLVHPKDKTSKTVQPKPLSATSKHSVDVSAVRSAIDTLEVYQPVAKFSKNFITGRQDTKQHSGAYNHKQGHYDQQNDSVSMDFTTLMRMASQGTKKVFRKIKSAELSPKKLWKRNNANVVETGSDESLSSAGPSTFYHFPQDVSPVTNNSPGTSANTSDMDTPFSTGTRTVDSFWRHNENQQGQGLLRRKASGALKYVQKFKVASTVGGWIPKGRTRNGATEDDAGETAWNCPREERSENRDESMRERLVRSLSF